METAKDILDRFIHHPRHLNLEEAAMKFAKEIADKAWEASETYLLQRLEKLEHGKPVTAPNELTFMKSLFPLKEI